jgi:hypothetical protein
MQQQEDLVSRGLATKKVNTKLNLVTYKYAKRVMYDYLWAQYPELMECRGHTYCIKTGELVLCPPQKSFNYNEAGNLPQPVWLNKPLNTPVLVARKWNGFMASARIWNGELVVATTGTTNEETSKYVGWAKEEIAKNWRYIPGTMTGVFEIIHKEDPHIVDDGVQRAVNLLGRGSDGSIWPIGLDQMTVADVLELAKTEKHEGWMVYDRAEFEQAIPVPLTCKVKTDYYVGKKKLMRMSASKVHLMFNCREQFIVVLGLPKKWYNLAKAIVATQQQTEWGVLTDQERRVIIEALEPEFYN